METFIVKQFKLMTTQNTYLYTYTYYIHTQNTCIT